MSRPLRVALILVGFLVVVSLLVPYIVSVDRYRPQIEAAVLKQTGRKLEMGALRARLLPSVGFTIEKVTLGPPQGFASVNLLTADSIRGSVALYPLLRGNVEVTSVDVEKPELVLATDERGKTNYDFSSHAEKKGAAADDPPVHSSSPVTLDSMNIRDATVSLVEVRGHKALPPSVKLTGVNAEFSNVDLAPQGTARWQGTVPLTGVKMEFAGAPPVTFRSGEAKLNQGAVTGNCEAELAGVGRAKGDFSVPSIQKLLAASPGGRNEVLGTGKFTSASLRDASYEITNVSADPRLFFDRIEGPITAAAYGGSVHITARLDTGPTPPRISASIHVSQLDIERLLAADPSTRGKMTGHGELNLQLAAPLSTNLENSLTGQGSFALRDGKLPGVELGKSMRELSKVEEILSLGAAGHETAGETTFSVIEGDLEVQGGRLHTNKTHLQTNVGHGDMRGSVGFDQTLDLTGTWALPAASRTGAGTMGAAAATVLTGGILAPALVGAAGGSLSVPFSVKGTIKDPKLIPGGGFPGFEHGSNSSSAPQQQQQKKKGFLGGLFSKP